MRRILLLLPILALPACTWLGLFVGGLGVGGVAHGMQSIEENKAWRDYESSMPKTWKAVEAELKKRKVELKNKPELTEEGGEFKGGKGWVKVYSHPKFKEFTRVEVKIGTFKTDDKFNITRDFLEDVGQRLGYERRSSIDS